MRIGVVCPYSLTVPGGVQSQVLGMVRALRAKGHEARALGPCDGPPPYGWITPLGNSIPTAANGSIAPLAPDPSAQLRFIRAVRDEGFDVLHLHEPLAPGATMTAMRDEAGAAHRHVPRRRRQRLVSLVHPVRALGGRTARPALRRVAMMPAAWWRSTCRVEYEELWNGIEIERYAKADPWPTEGPTIMFVGRHEPRKGLAMLLGAMAELPADVRLWVGGDGPETEELKMRHAGDPASVGWAGCPTRRSAAGLRGATCSARRRSAVNRSEWCCWRRWRRRRRSSPAICPATGCRSARQGRVARPSG